MDGSGRGERTTEIDFTGTAGNQRDPVPLAGYRIETSLTAIAKGFAPASLTTSSNGKLRRFTVTHHTGARRSYAGNISESHRDLAV